MKTWCMSQNPRSLAMTIMMATSLENENIPRSIGSAVIPLSSSNVVLLSTIQTVDMILFPMIPILGS
jgi:hypothetical protein